MYLLFIYLVNMMKLLVVACCVVLSISQIQALPTNGNKVEIEFSKGSNIYLTRDAGNVQENEAQNIEEALFSYTRLLNGVNQQSEIQQPLLQEDLYDNLAKEQTSALCPDPSCDCEDTKLGNFQGTRRDTGELCTLISVAYCQGVCPSSHRYFTLKLDTDISLCVHIHVTPCTGIML